MRAVAARVASNSGPSKAAGIASQRSGWVCGSALTDRSVPCFGGVHACSLRCVVTNVARHADRARTTVQLAYGERALTVSIDDHGPCVPGDAVTAGTGLTGMRERVTALGGTLDAAPRRIRDPDPQGTRGQRPRRPRPDE
ncbi:hypothetical protein ACIO3R_19220 [Streptomyces sp. NPDC087428]|uniref:ATP-binding protein n=1 Tax=Streptomyces sp. NPDC087428 TaxID=3365788 RepID=UPI00381ABE1B